MVLYDRARVGPTTKTSDEISIICLFRLILQANPLFLFWVVAFELLQCQVLIPYLSEMVFSYSDVDTNPSWSSRLFLSILFNRRASLQEDPIISTSARSSISSSQWCLFHLSPSCLCFSRPPTFFLQRFRFLNQASFYSCEVSPFLFRQCSYPVILRKILTELQVHHYSFSFFSSGLN